MLIFPAIDLKDGRVVRLTKGDYARMTVYGDDPLAVARGYREAGAACLHVVDLDGAKDGARANFAIVEGLAKVGLFMEVGGGARDEASVRGYIEAGAARVIIGSAAITRPGFLGEMAAKFPGKIAAGVDAKDGLIAIHGWKEITSVRALDFLRGLPGLNVAAAIYTDIARDGMLMGCNLDAYRETLSIAGLDVVASGGVSSLADIRALRGMGLYAAIVGKALYDGRLNLADAIREGEG